ncbi:hypothetical protein STW0522CIT19_06530 [Citrobacter freundii]|nr:hypothetical protein STW0522CIT01_06530 [Citrobacter freundii]BBV34178.1 hypothetical protein STW0522CIT19_06530 [Citrobacter freundii]
MVRQKCSGIRRSYLATALQLKNILLSVHPFTFADFLIKFM